MWHYFIKQNKPVYNHLFLADLPYLLSSFAQLNWVPYFFWRNKARTNINIFILSRWNATSCIHHNNVICGRKSWWSSFCDPNYLITTSGSLYFWWISLFYLDFCIARDLFHACGSLCIAYGSVIAVRPLNWLWIPDCLETGLLLVVWMVTILLRVPAWVKYLFSFGKMVDKLIWATQCFLGNLSSCLCHRRSCRLFCTGSIRFSVLGGYGH